MVCYGMHIVHCCYLRYNEEMPVYINMIRDPLERLVSWYYFIRFQPGHERKMSRTERRRVCVNACISFKVFVKCKVKVKMLVYTIHPITHCSINNTFYSQRIGPVLFLNGSRRVI